MSFSASWNTLLEHVKELPWPIIGDVEPGFVRKCIHANFDGLTGWPIASREIEFVDELPLTATGKLRRRDLRDREELLD